MMTNRILTNAEIMMKAPSVFSEESKVGLSDKYRFLSTINVIDALRDNGYQPVMAGQSRSKFEGNRVFAKHIIRMRHSEFLNKPMEGEVPELVLTNSHNGTSTYELMFGIFRLVCSNGMIVASSSINSIRVIHRGDRDLLNQIIDLSKQISAETPKIFDQINMFKSIKLTFNEQVAYAKSMSMVSPSSIKIDPYYLLQSYRSADNTGTNSDRDLWTTTNVIQEKLVKGGVRGRTSNGMRRRTTGISSIKNLVDVNKAIWTLTEEMAKIKQQS
jgi:hypothetical protein